MSCHLLIKKNVSGNHSFLVLSNSRCVAVEPVALIAGCQTAVHQAVAQQGSEAKRLERLREIFEFTVCKMAREFGIDPWIICKNTKRSPHISTIAFPGIDRQVFMTAADLNGLAVATGTACASGPQELSPALVAMDLPKLIQSAIRFSFGRTTHGTDIENACEKINQILQKHFPVHPIIACNCRRHKDSIA